VPRDPELPNGAHKRSGEAYAHARVALRGELTVDDPVALLRALADLLEDRALHVDRIRYTRSEPGWNGPSLEAHFRRDG
jgi:hypothetical protein